MDHKFEQGNKVIYLKKAKEEAMQLTSLGGVKAWRLVCVLPGHREGARAEEEGKEQGTAEKQLKRGLNSQKKTAAAVPWRA